jgi:23S rRNA (uracil1939-C5)-methyltransferase
MSETELSIGQLGPKGDGVHFGPTERIYAERTLPGDRIKAIVRRDRMGIARAEIVEILEPSPERVAAPCVHYDRCGNCTLQHMALDHYRNWKTTMVRDAFKKQRLHPVKWLDPIFIGQSKRRRATFSALKSGPKLSLGYYRRRSQEIVDVDSCLVAHPRILEVRNALKPLLPHLLPEGHPVDIFVQLVGTAIDLVFTGPCPRSFHPDSGLQDDLSLFAMKNNIARISWRRLERELPVQIVNRAPVVAMFGMIQVPMPAAAFMQPTQEGQTALANAVMAALPFRVSANSKLADLFAGCGTFSGPMLERGAVDAYESLPLPVNALNRAATHLPLRVFRRDLFSDPLKRDEINKYDAVVFDPPRSGCPEQAANMARAKTRTLVGISCNPATFARDARILVDGGYRMQSVQIVDQFLWSHHVELVGVFVK